METYLRLLSSYSGRDKILRTTSFTAMYLSGRYGGNTAKKLSAVIKQINSARVVLRLFDDFPMLFHTLSYGTGKPGDDKMNRVLTVLANMAGQLYYPVEHIAWAADSGLINLRSSRFWTAGIYLWIVSLVTNILKSLRKLALLQSQIAALKNQRKLESPDKRDSDDLNFKKTIKELGAAKKMEILIIVKCGADLMNAINWLPAGILWAGKLKLSQSGFFGMVASAIGIYQLS